MEEKRVTFDIQLNEISDTDDPTIKEVEFILHDFRQNLNGSIIRKETAQEALPTLDNKPIVAKYYENTEVGSNDDALGGHEAVLGRDREDGDYIVELKTTPIGVFTDSAYITTIEENGEEIEVVAGKGVLWNTRFSNAVGLIQEWFENGVDVVSSMEILYDQYMVKDGVEEILNYVYEGHAVLNSEDRGDHDKVNPAYDVSKLTRLVAEAVNGQGKESETMGDKYQKTLELSHDDIRAELNRQVDEKLEDGNFTYVVDVYESYFIVDVENEDGWKFYKVSYTKGENDEIQVDMDSMTEVKEDRQWVEVATSEQMQAELQAQDIEIQNLKAEKESVTSTKEDLEGKLNTANEQIQSLNTKVEELGDYKEKYDNEQYEKSLNEKKEYYSSKFSALNATEKYESDEVQELVKKSVDDEQAVFELNSMIIDLVEAKEENPEQKHFTQEPRQSRKLIEGKDDFDSRYK